eukprot:scaffold1519_cov99-Isochrysis_galbana.AAC.9
MGRAVQSNAKSAARRAHWAAAAEPCQVRSARLVAPSLQRRGGAAAARRHVAMLRNRSVRHPRARAASAAAASARARTLRLAAAARQPISPRLASPLSPSAAAPTGRRRPAAHPARCPSPTCCRTVESSLSRRSRSAREATDNSAAAGRQTALLSASVSATRGPPLHRHGCASDSAAAARRRQLRAPRRADRGTEALPPAAAPRAYDAVLLRIPPPAQSPSPRDLPPRRAAPRAAAAAAPCNPPPPPLPRATLRSPSPR